jgi:colanic acid/amylovoran biosynthesis protein
MNNAEQSAAAGCNGAASIRILIVNGHSQANAGDHAIVLGQLQLLKKKFPAARITITSRTPGLDRPAMAAWGVEVIAPLFHSPAGFQGRWRGRLRAILSLLFPLPAVVLLRRLRRSDLVLACGGGYFYSSRRIPGFTFWQNVLPLRLAVMLKKKIVFFPQSYGPLASPFSRRLLAGVLASRFVQVAFAREDISLSVLRGLLPAAAENKLRFCPDMAFFVSPPDAAACDFSGLPHPRVALALRDWDFPAQKNAVARERKKEEYLAGVLETCRALHRGQGASFLLFSQAQGPSRIEDDRRITAYVHGRLREFIPGSHLRQLVPSPAGAPTTIIQLLQQADLLIASRMHAAIFAFLAGTPAVVIGYQHKSLGILQAMAMAVCALPIENVRQETLLPLCESILGNGDDWRNKIRQAVSAARAAIEEKFGDVF